MYIPVQYSFAAGEISPLVQHRSDEAVFKTAVQEMVNFKPDVRGPLVRRAGTSMQWFDDIGEYGQYGRIIAFNTSQQNAYIVLVTNKDIIIFDKEGVPGLIGIITNPSFNEGVTGWTIAGPVEPFNGYVTLGRPYGDSDIDIQLSTSANTINGVAVSAGTRIELNYGGYERYTPIQTEHLVAFGQIGDIGNVSVNGKTYYVKSTYYDSSQDKTLITFHEIVEDKILTFRKVCPELDMPLLCQSRVVLTTFGAGSGDASIEQVLTLVSSKTYTFTVSVGSEEAEYKITAKDGSTVLSEINIVGSEGILSFTAVSAQVTLQIQVASLKVPVNITHTKIVEEGVVPTGHIKFPSPYTSEKVIDELQYTIPPDLDTMYIASRDVEPQQLQRDDAGVWTFAPVSYSFDASVTDAPWHPDPPGSVEYHKGRIWYGGSYKKRATIWATQSGVYTGFEFGSHADDNAMEFIVQRRGSIRWLHSKGVLIIGTSTNISIVESDGHVITPSDASSKEQSTYSCARIQPVSLDLGILWVDSERRKTFYSEYSREKYSQVPLDTSFVSEHLTKPLIKSMAYIEGGNNVACYVMNDGTFVGNSLEIRRDINGWHKHKTEGMVISSVVLDEFGTDVYYLLVLRQVGGIAKMMLEKVDSNLAMDSAVRIDSDSLHYMHIGFEHLEGQTVQIIETRDGRERLLPDQVVNGASLTFLKPVQNLVVGLGYTAKVKTLPIEMVTQAGSILPKQKRFSKLFVRILGSARPIINGENVRQRTPITPMGEREPNETTDIQTTKLGHDRYAHIEIEQELPFPCTILGIFGEMSGSNL